MKRDDINKALNILTDLTVDYGKRNAEEIKELDDALDVVQMAAQAYEQLGADNYKTREQNARNKEYARGFAESREAVESILADQGVLYQITNADFRDADTITLQPKKGDPVEYWKAKRGYWEPMDEPHIMPMAVCSECQKTNFYPGRYCTYCQSDNGGCRRMIEKKMEIVAGKCPIEAGGNCPLRPQGKWIKQYGKSYELITNEGVLVGEFTKCPKCQYDKARGSNFCPNCGADMRGGEE